MSKISKQNQERIMSNIISILFENSPEALFTSEISKIEARDEEFIKNLLIDLKEKNLITEIKKNHEGKPYLKRSRWKLSDAAYNAYRKAGSQTQDNKLTTDKTYIKTD